MEISIDRECFLQILAHTQGVVDKRHSMAVLTNVLLEADDGKLTVTATDLEVSLQQVGQADVKEGGRAATSARKLFEIVREASSETVTLKTADNQWVEVSYGRSVFKLVGIDPEEHPGMPAIGQNGGKTSSIELDAGDLAEVIRKTIFAVSLDDTRSNLAGVYLEKGTKKGQVRLVATDGHRLAMVDRKVKGQGPDKGVILPKKGLAELAKLLPDETGNVALTIGGNTVTADLGGRLFNMRLVEGNFPDYHQVVPKETLKIITAERDELLQTMRRVSILSSERARGIKLSLKEGALEIAANNPDLGEAHEDIGIEYDGDEFEIGFNARYMVEVLGVLPEGSKIEIGLSDELSPGVIRGDDRDYSYVVMPMRI